MLSSHPAPAAQQGSTGCVPEPLPMPGRMFMACPAAEQEFHQLGHPLLAPNLLPELMRWPRHAASHPMPSSCHGNSHMVTHGGAQGFIYVQSQPPQHIQHSSRLTQEAAHPTPISQLSKWGHTSPELQASGQHVVGPHGTGCSSTGELGTHPGQSWGCGGSRVSKRESRSAERSWGEQRVGEMVTGQGRGPGQGRGLGECRNGADGAHLPGGLLVRDKQDHGLRSASADGTPTNMREDGTREDWSRLRDPHAPAAGRRGDTSPFPPPDKAVVTPKPVPTLPQAKGTLSAPGGLSPAPCQPHAGGHLGSPQALPVHVPG